MTVNLSFGRPASLLLALLATVPLSCSSRVPEPEAVPAQSASAVEPSATEPTEPSAPATNGTEAVVSIPPTPSPDDQRRAKIVGVWKQNYTGTRWLSIRPDGTATMFIDPDWLARAIIGDRLTVQVAWTIEDGHALLRSVSGEPAAAFKAVNRLFGNERNRLIAELNESKFVLLDEQDDSRSEWTRVTDDETLPAELGVR